MNTLQTYMPIAEQMAGVIDYMMMEELGLMPPVQYELTGRDGRVYLVASFNPLELGRALKPYENPDVARRLSKSLADLPVAITKKTGTRYVVLLTGKLRLPKSVNFPANEPVIQDVFRMGIGLKGEVRLPASQLLNVIITASQGSGKSNLLHLLTHQMRMFGWTLYLADPQSHTFNPDVWSQIAAAPVAGSVNDVLMVLDRVEGELADRVVQFRDAARGGIPPKDIEEYNRFASETSTGSERTLPRIGLVMDEVNTYLGNKVIFKRMADLLRQGRKWGLHVVLAGHEWHKENVPSELNDMLQTRIALSSPVEISGTVVLRSSHWGKWVMDKPAGRGVLKTRGYIPMQFYLVTDEMQREWLGGVITPAPLSDEEQQMVRYAIEHGGDFKIREIASAVSGVTEWTVRTTAEKWERRGWLAKPQDAVSSRRVTPKLADLAGISLTGSQASQGITGVSQASQGHSQGLTGLTGA